MTFAANSPDISREDRQSLTVDNTFVADCTLYLENETLIRRKIPGRWYSRTRPTADEWLKQAQHCLDWIVGTLHIHDPKIPCRVDKVVVHHWHKEQSSGSKPGR